MQGRLCLGGLAAFVQLRLAGRRDCINVLGVHRCGDQHDTSLSQRR
jgi:hypothetical protein